MDPLDIALLLALLFSLCFFGVSFYLVFVRKKGGMKRVKVKVKNRGSWWMVPGAPILAFIVVVAGMFEMVGLLLINGKEEEQITFVRCGSCKLQFSSNLNKCPRCGGPKVE